MSTDSQHSHRVFAQNMGGLPYPLLSDFHPKGEAAKAYDLWNPDLGTSRRAVIIIDRGGTVRYRQIWQSGRPDPQSILEEVTRLD